MKIETLKAALMQGNKAETAQIFRQILTTVVRAGLLATLEEEVSGLCGKKHYPKDGSCYRHAGSEVKVVYLDAGKERIRRQRVRRADGGEVRLATYEAASSSANIFEQVVGYVAQGMSVRGVGGNEQRKLLY